MEPAQALLILLTAWVANRLVRRAIRRMVASMTDDGGLAALRAPTALARTGEIPSLRRVQRAETVGALLKSVASFGIWTLAGLMALGTLGLDLGPLIAGAGIVGVAVGFGSQNLVRDFISGIFMLMEDQYGVGDVVDAGPATGTVEGVGLRTTRLRDVNGTLWHIPNGEIRRVGNRSQGWARALVDVEVAYSTDLDDATRTIERVAHDLYADPHWASRILEQPEVWGWRSSAPTASASAWSPRPAPRAVERGPRAPRPPQGRLRPGRHRGLRPEGRHHQRRPEPAGRLIRGHSGGPPGQHCSCPSPAVDYSRGGCCRALGATEAGGDHGQP